MLKWEEQMKIKFLVGRGHSIRETARLTGHARSTVRGVLRGKTEVGTGTETHGPQIKACGFQVSTGVYF
jgi:hypothetical protein